jgi:hypothetical protein
MADLPRYENLGAQYADLPRLSTALQQAQAQGYADLGSQLDRMTSFLNQQAFTEAQKAGLKYAVDFPPTKEQLDVAKSTGVMPVVQGAGTAFTETYNKASAHILGNELQINFQNRLSTRLAEMEAGGEVDPVKLQADLRDDIDGTVSVLTALDPETSIKFRASMATVGHTAYAQALKIDERNRQAFYTAEQEKALMTLKPVIENVIKTYTAVGMDSNNLEEILQNIIQPFTNRTSIVLAGGNKYAIEAYKIVNDAKVGAVLAKLSDPKFAPTAGAAAEKLNKGDVGELTGIYKGLDEDTKIKIRTQQIKAVADAESLNRIEKEKQKAANKVAANNLTIEFLQSGTSSARKKQIINELVMFGEMTLSQAQDLLKPKEAQPNPMLSMQLYDNIKNGRITSINELVPFASKMSRSEFESLARSTVDTQSRAALDLINRESGILSDLVQNPSDKLQKRVDLTKIYTDELNKKIPGANGVLRYQNSNEAVESAIKRYNGDKIYKDKAESRNQAVENYNKIFEKNPKAKKPNLPIDQVDPSAIQGLTDDDKKRINGFKKQYKDNL